jgi:hypothetical protein
MNDRNNFNPFGKSALQGPKLEDLLSVSCLSCSNSIFDQYYRMYKLSALNSPTGKAQVFNVPVFVCSNCGEILDVKKIENGLEESVDKSKSNDNT